MISSRCLSKRATPNNSVGNLRTTEFSENNPKEVDSKMKMNMKRLTRRGILGVIALTLVIGSASALFLFSSTLPALTVSNPAGLTSLCASPLIAGTTINNGTSGGHESFTTAYSCSTPIASPYSPTATAQGVLSVVTAASYIPSFIVDT